MTTGIGQIASAIGFIPADDRSVWVEVGMAVKSELGDAGFPIWDDWSKQSESYRPESSKAVWKSIRECGKITVGTLFHHARCHGWRDDGTHQRLTPKQIADRRRESQERASAADKAAEIEYAKAAKRAVAIIKTCSLGAHPYLESKGFSAERALIRDDGALVIPMRASLGDAIVGAQIIRLVENQWEKKMLPGMRAKGAVFRIGPMRAGETWLVEGYATGVSVYAALKLMRMSASVLVCFSAGNLAHVAGLLLCKGFVFADNDESQAGERAAIATGLRYVMSPTVGQDANDLHQISGLMAVAKLIMEARNR
jgi:putative DNA primase/helicase